MWESKEINMMLGLTLNDLGSAYSSWYKMAELVSTQCTLLATYHEPQILKEVWDNCSSSERSVVILSSARESGYKPAFWRRVTVVFAKFMPDHISQDNTTKKRPFKKLLKYTSQYGRWTIKK
jgi:hypothetical protein